jgi:predicted nucleotidyltransferase
MATVESALREAAADLAAVKVLWALVGGLAVSTRTVPRFTKDVDFAVAVASDHEAEDVVHRLGSRGYNPVEVIEQDYVERLSGVRLARAGSDVVVDLLFASSGIENEVVASADRLEVLPNLTVPVATTGHLIALKVLAGRNQDLTDLGYLIPAASAADLDTARSAVTLIQSRGFNRDQDVVADLEKLISDERPLRPPPKS